MDVRLRAFIDATSSFAYLARLDMGQYAALFERIGEQLLAATSSTATREKTGL